jgi:hypothetical protein
MADTPQQQTPAETGQPTHIEVVLVDRNAPAAYANFARVNATPEEVIIDFALNPNPYKPGRTEVPVTQRLIMNYYTAKRLCVALSVLLQEHERLVGPIETNVHRRALPQPQQRPQG